MHRAAAALAAAVLLAAPSPAQIDLRGAIASWVSSNQRAIVAAFGSES